jgi:hypothetical protein
MLRRLQLISNVIAHGARARLLHQVRSDLGRLDAIAEILQVRLRVNAFEGAGQKARVRALGGAVAPVIYRENESRAS